MSLALPELEKRPYVERYSWKTRSQADSTMSMSAIFKDADGSLTPLGEYYSSFQSTKPSDDSQVTDGTTTTDVTYSTEGTTTRTLTTPEATTSLASTTEGSTTSSIKSTTSKPSSTTTTNGTNINSSEQILDANNSGRGNFASLYYFGTAFGVFVLLLILGFVIQRGLKKEKRMETEERNLPMIAVFNPVRVIN
jgi:hypothetical protein